MKSKRRKLNYEATPSLDCLNDYCLMHIFRLLPLKTRIILERVNKRWKQLSESLWKQQREIHVNFSDSNNLSNIRFNATKHLNDILKRCAPHSIKTLKIGNCSTRTLFLIAEHCPNIEYLELFSVSVSSDGIKSLSICCKNLREIHFRLCSGITDAGLRPLLLGNKNIQVLDLYYCKGITGAFLKYAPKSLQHMDIGDCNTLKDQYFKKNFKHFNNLLKLNLNGCQSLQPSSITCIIANAPELHDLSLGLCNLPNSPILLNQLKHLINLDLSSNKLCDHHLKIISTGCLKLEVLNISGCDLVTNMGIQQLTKLTSLKVLDISHLELINDHALLCLSASVKQTLIQLNCSSCPLITNLGVKAILIRCKKLTHLDISRNFKITTRTIFQAISIIETRPTNLNLFLKLYSNGVHFKYISKTNELTYLYVT